MNPPPSFAHERIASELYWLLRPYADAAGLYLVGIGAKDDNRVPDLAVQRPQDAEPQWQRTAAPVVEILSPSDETMDKLPFYAAHEVDELVIVDPDKRSVDWLRLRDGAYQPTERSDLIELGAAELTQQINWP